MAVDLLIVLLAAALIGACTAVLLALRGRRDAETGAASRVESAERRQAELESELERLRADLWTARVEAEDARSDGLIDRLESAILDLAPAAGHAGGTQALRDAARLLDDARRHRLAGTTERPRYAAVLAAEGLLYVRAARTALGRDAGPRPVGHDRERSGAVTEQRTATVQEHTVAVGPAPSETTPYYFAGRDRPYDVPEGWYSEPWWDGSARNGDEERDWGPELFAALFDRPHPYGVRARPSDVQTPSGTTYGSIGVGGDASGASGHGAFGGF